MSGETPTDPKTDLEAHRLHRDPADVDGLRPENDPDHRAPAATERRASAGDKPYTAETESYGRADVRSPDDPVERAEATRPPRR